MKKRIIGCSILVIVIAAFICVSIFGISVGKLTVPEKLGLFTNDGGIKRGLDLDGGASITFRPVLDENYSGNVSEDIDVVIEVMRRRLTNLGYTEANVYKSGNDRVTVEIPGISNADEAISVLGQTAKLRFIDSAGTVVLEGSDIVSADAGMNKGDTGDHAYIVSLTLSEDAVEKFAKSTAEMAKLSASGKNYISIYLDDTAIASPRVTSEIRNTTCQITGLTYNEALEYSALISAGRLPFALQASDYSSIGPTLGAGALENSVLAAGIGLLIIAVLMIILYKLPGLVSVISLAFYVSIVGLILAIFEVNLSLPGIAGIILSIGMAVDANVVIFERIKEELRLGKSTMAAVKSGFSKAITAVLDSNITTIIAAIVLLIFGTGTIKGFAITLLIGVIVSLITAVFVTKYLLNCLIAFKVTNPSLYGLSKKEKKPFTINYTKFRKPIAILTAVIIVAGIALGTVSYMNKGSFGINWGIDFTGGTVLEVSIKRDVTSDDIAKTEQILKDIGETNATVSITEVPAIDTSVLGSKQVITIKTGSDGNELQRKIVSAMAKEFSLPYTDSNEKVDADSIDWLLSCNSVGPAAASDLMRSALLSTVVASVLMLLYITIRFDIFSGIAAVVALLHDISMMIILNSIFRIQTNLTFIAAVLTILGYSINATIIIFDRVRENTKKGEITDFGQIANVSTSQMFTRSLFTSVTTLATIATLYFLSVPSIKEFAFPIIVGIVCGLISSLFISGSVWTLMKNARAKHKKKAQ